MATNLNELTMTDYIGMGKEIIANMVKILPEPVDSTILVVGKEKVFQIVLTGTVPNDPDAKGATLAMAKKVAKEENASAVLIFGDLWVGWTDAKDTKLHDRINQIGMEEAHRQGLVKKREALWCKIMTRTHEDKIFLQYYRRENDGRDIVIEEEEEPNYQMSIGRMSDFFPPQATA